MSIFRDFFVKEKPVFTGITRGVGGFGFGGGGGAAPGPDFSASGGAKVEPSDGYTYHIFVNPNSDNLVVSGTVGLNLLWFSSSVVEEELNSSLVVVVQVLYIIIQIIRFLQEHIP